MDCTFLVNSCDAYSDLWAPYFKLLAIQWPDCPYPIVLNTESKTFKDEKFDVKTFSLYPAGADIPWGKRLIDTLTHIDTKYILFTLDDYFLKAPPNIEYLNKCFRYMEETPSISVFYFRRTPGMNYINNSLCPGFEKIPLEHTWRLRCQMSLWRRDKLLSYILPHESPWEWEAEGSIRSREYKEDFYVVDKRLRPNVFTYGLPIKGGSGALWQGRWVRQIASSLNKKYRLGIDFSQRGFQPVYLPRFREAMIKLLETTRTYPFARQLYHSVKNIFRRTFIYCCIVTKYEYIIPQESLVTRGYKQNVYLYQYRILVN